MLREATESKALKDHNEEVGRSTNYLARWEKNLLLSSTSGMYRIVTWCSTMMHVTLRYMTHPKVDERMWTSIPRNAGQRCVNLHAEWSKFQKSSWNRRSVCVHVVLACAFVPQVPVHVPSMPKMLNLPEYTIFSSQQCYGLRWTLYARVATTYRQRIAIEGRDASCWRHAVATLAYESTHIKFALSSSDLGWQWQI
jgi:hypothetical protein